MKYVYLFKSDSGEYKVGVSKHPEKRLKEHQTGNPENLTMIVKFSSEFPHKVESAAKNYLKPYQKNREWFDLPLEVELDFLFFCERTERNLRILHEKND